MQKQDISDLLHERAARSRVEALDGRSIIDKARATRRRQRAAIAMAGVAVLAAGGVLGGLALAGGPGTRVPTIGAGPDGASLPDGATNVPPASGSPSTAPSVNLPVGWAAGASGPLGVFPAAAALVGDHLVFWSGEIGSDAESGYSQEGESLALPGRTWTGTAESPIRGRALPGVASNGQVMFVWGGTRNDTGPVADGATYAPETNKWQTVSPSPLTARIPLGAVWNGAEFVVVGGVDADGKVQADVAAYNPDARTWRRLPALPQALGDGKVVQLEGRTFVVGSAGSAIDRPLQAFLLASPESSAWTSIPGPAIGPAQLRLASDGTSVLAVGQVAHRSAAQPEPMRVERLDTATMAWSLLPSLPRLRGLLC